jgi:plasmid stability protein
MIAEWPAAVSDSQPLSYWPRFANRLGHHSSQSERLPAAGAAQPAMRLRAATVGAQIVRIWASHGRTVTAEQRRWAEAAVAQPEFRIVPAGASEDSLRRAAAEAEFPCVVKSVSLSASQGCYVPTARTPR